MEKFVQNENRKNYLVNEAYRNTETWKKSRKTRLIFNCGGVILPLAVFGIFSLLLRNAIYALIPAFVALIFSWVIVVAYLKFERSLSEIIPTDRKNDEVVIDDDQFSYRYFSKDEHMFCIYTMKKADIRSISVDKETMFVEGAFRLDRIRDRETGYRSEYDIDDHESIDIPLYFDDDERMIELLKVSEKSKEDDVTEV